MNLQFPDIRSAGPWQFNSVSTTQRSTPTAETSRGSGPSPAWLDRSVFLPGHEQPLDLASSSVAAAPHRRIKLDTLPFFDLMTRVPHALKWVLARREGTVFYDGVVYEISE